ncbi:MAG: beta-ketoacyl synthase N-terminal-like domain-containing protein, partial [Firmicutes bacterium]|nr:beta-ketoacyl synthase N-terminal-like domain-containing protein [Bacillota bacterium]
MPLSRVVVTGMGAITPIGIGIEMFKEGLFQGRSGIDKVSRFDASDYPTQIAAEIKDFDPLQYFDRKDTHHMDRFTQLALVAAREAMQDAGLPGHFDPANVGVAIGTGIGGLETLIQQQEILSTRGPRRVSPFLIPKMIAN